ncbi:polysaccharide deacetylase family protein [Fimbriimonas ginsengisoli]|nr:polysaccharide deacetylase family protein [Fimbriimonas ginsengisoli]
MRNRFVTSLPLLSLAFVAVSCRQEPPKPVVLTPPPATSGVAEVQRPPFTEISMRSQGQRVPVIMYHDIIDRRDRNAVWFDTTLEEFQDQMKQLQEWGAVPISLDQLYDHLTKGTPVPETAIVLTFDDNYQGFYDRALPILRQNKYPAAVFVHTGFVGNKEGLHPKMDWTELQELVKDPLITIGNHTITHPTDLTKLDPEAQRKEIFEAKADLEQHLGKKIDYFAYPEGNNDLITQGLVREAGHKMAFTVHNGPAEESPNIVAVDRYIQTKLKNAWDDRETDLKGGVLGVLRSPIKDAPVKYQEVEQEGVKLGLITGGVPTSLMSPTREGVLDFIKRTPGSVAGINGGFFAMAAVAATDNKMVGPCKTADMPEVAPDLEQFRWEKLRNRPLVAWSQKEFAIVPFVPESMHDASVFADFMPDMTDTFLAGVWLVHGGVARERDDMDTFSSKDIQDARKRAFLGVMADGSFVIGASLESVSSANLAKAIAAAGVSEAVLLDSGFSTSLVYGQSIKAFGHSTPTNPSRPIPHAVLIKGVLDPATAPLGAPDPAAPVSTDERPHRRRRHRRK